MKRVLLLSYFLIFLLSSQLSFAQNAPNFLGTLTMQTEKYDAKQTQAAPRIDKVVYAITDKKVALTFEQAGNQKMQMIYDQTAHTITSYTSGANSNKIATVMNMSSEQIYQFAERATAPTNLKYPSVVSTDEVKNIAGYECRKYVVETPKYVMTLWATDKIRINIAQLMTYMGAKASSYDADQVIYLNGENGTALETEMVHKITNDKLKLSIQDLQKSVGHATFDLSGYSIQDMSSIKIEPKK